MGKASRDKGARFERECVNDLKEGGVNAIRVPLSGMGHEKSEDGDFAGDLVLSWFGAREKFEAKKRGGARGFKMLYDWLGRHRGLIVAGDRKEKLVVLRMSDFIRLMRDKDRLHKPE